MYSTVCVCPAAIRYMLTFLRAYDGDTSAENKLKEYRQSLQIASKHIARNTDTKFILTHGSCLQRANDFLILRIHGYPDRAKLYFRDLAEPYGEDNIPAVMTDLDVVLKYRTEIRYRSETGWGWLVVMDDGTGVAQDMDKPLADNAKLREYLEKLGKKPE